MSQDFIETINIGQENTDFDIYVEDVDAKLRASEGLHAIFNEAKLNLVRLLLILESIFPSNTKDNLNLANILKNAFIDCEDIDSFVSSNVGEIIREVNK